MDAQLGTAGGGQLVEAWMVNLKTAFDAGFYRTEQAVGSQEVFPWSDKRCGDCPFHEYGICRVRAMARSIDSHTCRYFDPSMHEEGRSYIADHDEFDRRVEWTAGGSQDR